MSRCFGEETLEGLASLVAGLDAKRAIVRERFSGRTAWFHQQDRVRGACHFLHETDRSDPADTRIVCPPTLSSRQPETITTCREMQPQPQLED